MLLASCSDDMTLKVSAVHADARRRRLNTATYFHSVAHRSGAWSRIPASTTSRLTAKKSTLSSGVPQGPAQITPTPTSCSPGRKPDLQRRVPPLRRVQVLCAEAHVNVFGLKPQIYCLARVLTQMCSHMSMIQRKCHKILPPIPTTQHAWVRFMRREKRLCSSRNQCFRIPSVKLFPNLSFSFSCESLLLRDFKPVLFEEEFLDGFSMNITDIFHLLRCLFLAESNTFSTSLYVVTAKPMIIKGSGHVTRKFVLGALRVNFSYLVVAIFVLQRR